MEESYYIFVSRKDIGNISYFPGEELKNEEYLDWIDDVLVPAVHPIAARTNKKIQEIPVTFWVCTRSTARYSSEIFLFVTPYRPGSVIEKALQKSLSSLKNGKIDAANETLSPDACPCLQIFRGKMLRLYVKDEDGNTLKPRVTLVNSKPALVFLPNGDYSPAGVSTGRGADIIPVETRITGILTGQECRDEQQWTDTFAFDQPLGSKYIEHPPQSIRDRMSERKMKNEDLWK